MNFEDQSLVQKYIISPDWRFCYIKSIFSLELVDCGGESYTKTQN